MTGLEVQITHKPESWHTLAACRGFANPDAFHADKHTPRGQVDAAKALCASCPVRRECRREAFACDDHWGIWGGLTEEVREDLRRLRRLQHSAA